jgi:hypothetical protein
MRNARYFFGVFGVAALVSQAPDSAYSQAPAQHDHGTALYVAAIEGQHVVPPVTTEASGTGAFILKGDGNRISLGYDLTYQSLPKPPRRIVLRNFGEGGVGRVVHVVCGGDEGTCTQQPGATLNGEWTDRHATLPLTAALARELVVGRIYVEVENEAGQGVVRGQIVTYDSMMPVEGFVVRLRPPGGAGGTVAASGTGAFYLAQSRGGSQVIAYHVTATGTDGAPSKALIVRAGTTGLQPGAPPRPLLEALPQKLPPRVAAEPAAGARGQRGGTISGAISAPPAGGAELFEKRLLTTRAEKLNVIIVTDAHPAGELIGELIPVE